MKNFTNFNFGDPRMDREWTEVGPRMDRSTLATMCRYIAVIFAVLVMSIANVGTAWGTDDTQIYVTGFESGAGTWSGDLTVTSETTNVRTGLKAIKAAKDATSAKSSTQATGCTLSSSSTIYCHIIGYAKAAGSSTSAQLGFNSSKKTSATSISTSAWTKFTYKGNSLAPSTIIIYKSGATTDAYFDDIVSYYSDKSTTDVTAPNAPASPSATASTISWTRARDGGNSSDSTGVQATLIWKRVSGSSDDLSVNQNGVYTVGDNDNTGHWQLVEERAVSYSTSSAELDANTRYALVHRDMAYNMSTAAYVSTPAGSYSGLYTYHQGIDGTPASWTITPFEHDEGSVYYVNNFTVPAAGTATHFYVGYEGYFYDKDLGYNKASHSKTRRWHGTSADANSNDHGEMFFAAPIDNGGLMVNVGQAAGAKGKIRINDDSNWNNLRCTFVPDGYKLKIGSTEYPFAVESGHEYRSGLVEFNSTTADDAVSVGLVDGSGDYVASDNSQAMRHIFLNTGGTSLWSKDGVSNFGVYDVTNGNWTSLLVLVPGESYLYEAWVPSNCTSVSFHRLKSSTPKWKEKDSDGSNTNIYNSTGDQTLQSDKSLFTITDWGTGSWSTYEKKGKFRMNDNYPDKNWYVRFYPYYVLSYDANGGSGAPSAQGVPVDGNSAARTVAVAAGSGMTPPTGYEFAGWNPDEDDADAGTIDGNYDPSDNVTLSADATLYAVWSPLTYTITLNGNGGSGHTSSVSATYNSSTLSDAITNPSLDCYTFDGWYSGEGGSGTLIIDEDGVLQASTSYTDGSGNWTNDGDVTLYAKWSKTPTSLTVSRSGTEATPAGGSPIGTAYTLTCSASTGSISSYQWKQNTTGSKVGAVDAEGTGTTSANFNPVPSDAGNYWYYCVATDACSNDVETSLSGCFTFTEPTYSVTYNANLTGTSGSTTGLSGKSDGFTFTTASNGFSRSGYKFKWWNTKSDGTGQDYYAGEKDTIASADQTLYARWDTVASNQAFWSPLDTASKVTGKAINITEGGMILTSGGATDAADINVDLTSSTCEVSKHSNIKKHAKVLAIKANDKYIDVHFSDGSPINKLWLGATTTSSSSQNIVVVYSATSDFTTAGGAAHEFKQVGSSSNLVTLPGNTQAKKAITDVSPSTTDTYYYARIYRRIATANSVFDNTANLGSGNTIRIYSIKAQKGASYYTGLSVTKDPSAGSASTPTISATSVEQGSGVTVTAGSAASGYVFLGWESENGTFADASSLSTTFTPTADNAVATAKYAAVKTITIKFLHNGNTEGWTVQGVTTYPADQSYSISVSGDWTVLTFSNVYAVSNINLACTGDDWDHLNTSTKVTENGCYEWDGDAMSCEEFSVTYAEDGATGGSVPTDANTYYTGQTVTVLGNTGSLTKTGYTFAGWNDGSTDYEAGDTFTMPDEDVTLTAQWTVNTYDVTHTFTDVSRTNGGTGGTNAATYGTNYSVTVEAEDGYELPDAITVTIGGSTKTAGTEYTWDSSTGEVVVDGDYILGAVVITITGEDEACTPQSLSKVVLSVSGEAVIGTATGYNTNEYAGTPVVKADKSNTDATNIDGKDGNETGYKMGSGGNSIVFATLAKGTFQEGDVVKIGITRRNDTREISSNKNILTIYYGTNKDDADSLTTISTGSTTTSSATAHEDAGFYEYELTAADATKIGSKKGIGLFRESSNGENPYVYSVEIIGCRDWSTCTAPTAVSAGTITSSGATFTITDAENTNNYEIYYSTSSTTPTAETSATATTGSKTKAVTGLTAETTYYYWVRSNCGGVTKSAWVAGTPASFTTEDAATTYSVTYDGNEKTGGSVPTDDNDYEEGDVVTVLGNTGSLVKTGQTFLGWSTSSTASTGTFYPAGYKYYMPNEDVTLYAVWGSTGCVTLVNVAANSSTTVSATVGSGTVNNPSSQDYTGAIKLNSSGYIELTPKAGSSFAAGNKITITMYCGADASKTIGFRLADKNDGNSMSASVAKRTEKTFEYTIVSGDITDGKIKIYRYGSESWFVSAIVEDCSGGGATGHTVTFNMNGKGSAISPIANVPSSSMIGAPVPSPTAAGVEFGGWYREAGCTNAWNFGSSTISKDTTLYAKWADCAPSISAHPAAATYTQDAAATALSVTASGEGLNYQWYTSEDGSADISGSSAIPGATSASYTPSTSLLGTIYYFCVVSNTCGNAVSTKAAITVNDSNPAPTAVWTGTEDSPKSGGTGWAVTVAAKKNDGSTLWDGNITTSMLTASAGVTLSGLEANNTTKTITGTYSLPAGVESPITFTLTLPATGTQAAASLDHNVSFTPCAGGVGSSYDIRVRKNVTKGGNYYYNDNADGWISPKIASSHSNEKSGTKMGDTDQFDTIYNTNTQYVWVRTYHANIKKVRIYAQFRAEGMTVSQVYKHTDFFTEADKYIVSYSEKYNDDSDATGTGEANAFEYVDITLTEAMDANDILLVKFNDNRVRPLGAILYATGDSGDQTTGLTWSNDQASGATVEKREDDADFTITAVRDATALKSLGLISYTSSNTAIATVNASTGLVHIADNIDFGSDEFKTTTITATLAASGCYQKKVITYILKVTKHVCEDAPGTITYVDRGCSGMDLTLEGYEEGATIKWYKNGTEIPSATSATYNATVPGEYYAVTHKTCDITSTNSVTLEAATATAEKIVDSWYVKNGRRTPDIALVQTTGATSFTVTSGGTITEIGGCTFELKEDGIIYLHGQKEDGSAPSDMTAGDMTITITVSGCAGALSGLDITIHKQAETPKPSVAFVVDGTLRKDGGTATSVSTAKTSDRPLWTYLSSSYVLTGCNAYWSVDSKELRQYYSQFDAILITDDPSTDTKGTGGVSYVKAFGTMVDVRPVLTMEAYVGKFKDGGWHVYDATPTSPNPRQVEMKLECKNHDIFKGLNPDNSDNVRSTTDDQGNEYWHVIMVDTTQAPYHNTSKDYKNLPALQGFDPTKFDHMLGVGTIADETLQGGVERQEEPAARMMILGIQNEAMAALTNEGKLIIKNAIEYLLKTNMEDVNDCSNYFTGGDSGTGDNWATAANWSSGKVPDYETRARILRPVEILGGTKAIAAHVDIVTSGNSKWVDGECNGTLTIKPQGALIVGGEIRRAAAPHYGIDELMPTEIEDITIMSSNGKGNGTLIFDNEDGDTQATVEMYSKAKNGDGNWTWQYVAVPFNDNASAYRNYYGSWLYRWAEDNSGWEVVPNQGEVYPWIGYCLTQESAKHYVMDGTLVETTEQTFTVGAGQDMVIGNSWTAPIQVKLFEDDDFGDLTKNIYLFNTGMDSTGTGTVNDVGVTGDARYAAGTYVVVPIHSAEYTGDSLISSLQAFTITNTSGGEATLTLNYDKHIRPAKSTDSVNAGPMHVQRRNGVRQTNPVVLKVWVSGSNYDDRLVLIEGEGFSTGYDDGWDGEKIFVGGNSPEIYSEMESGKESVTATNELEGTIIGFRAGEDDEYTISFTYDDEEELYLLDLDTHVYTRVDKENTYTFRTNDNELHSRFILTRKSPEVATGVDDTSDSDSSVKAKKFIYNNKMYILLNGMLYDATGKVVK